MNEGGRSGVVCQGARRVDWSYESSNGNGSDGAR